MTTQEEILKDYDQYLENNPGASFTQFIEVMTGVELVSTILTHIPRSAYEQILQDIS